MKGKSQVLQIDKCVVSRLWYTTWALLSKEIHSLDENYTRDEILELISLIQSEGNSQSDYQDRWIAQKILEILGVNNLAETPDLVEFILALKFVDKTIPSDVEEELLELFKNVSGSKTVKEKIAKITDKSLKFLELILEQYPPIACRVVKSLLCVWSQFFNESDAELQNLYIQSLERFLGRDEMQHESNKMVQEFRRTQSSSNLHSQGTLLSILSKLELTEAKNDQLLTWLFPALFNNCKGTDVGLALYARKSNEYFNEWAEFKDRILLRSRLPDSVENSFGISNAIFTFDYHGVEINYRELACRTVKLERHWLLDILDICYALLAAGNPEKVSTLLSVPILQGLWPTVCFKVLDNLVGTSETSFVGDERISWNLSNGLRFALGKCGPYFTGDKETWNKFKSGVDNQLDIVDWVLSNKGMKVISDKECRKDLTIKNVFSLLVNNGILHTLRTVTDLHQGNYEQVQNLLKNSTDSAATFKAYHSMLCALRAILLSDSYLTKTLEVGECLTDMRNTLKNLFPLDVRLEAIENVFSMLFLRHEDFVNSDGNSEESEEETDEKKIRETHYRRIQSGFICNKYIIRDLLHYLKGAISDAENERTENTANVSLALDDAIWRLELLTSSEFVRKVGYRGSEAPDDRKASNFSDILLTKKLNASKILTNRSIFYQQEDNSSNEDYTKSEVEVNSDAGSVETGNGTGSRRKFWKKNMGDKSLAFNSNYSFIVNFMLSSRESLIIQCLWKCDFDKAQQVIEMFNSSNSQLDGEVRFSKAISQFRHRMTENMEVPSPARVLDKNLETAMLQNIRLAVQEGIQTSRLTGQLETFLASNKATLRLINPEEVNTNEILTMTVLDLALTTGNSRSSSLNACDVASKYLKSCRIIEKTIYFVYFSKVFKLFCESKLDASLPDVLCDAGVPLSIQKFNDKLTFWNEVEKVVEVFSEAGLERKKSARDIQGLNLIRRLEDGLFFITELCDGEVYLSEIFEHLNILETILPKPVATDGSFDGNPFAMLELSVHSYLGHQFFELGIEPEELEVVANDLGVNLVHSILINCCPKFAFHDNIDKIQTSNKSSYIVLNENPENTILTEYDMEKPNECVSGILTDLLDTIGKIHPNKSTLRYADLQNLSKNIDVQNILRTTFCLANLNLCELTAGNETLTFFLNVWNLLFLHSVLTIWSKNAPCNKLQHAVSTTRIGYEIGDLGMVTLATLRCKLLGNLAWDLEFFKQIEEINDLAWQDLDLDQNPRVIFAMANEFFGTPAVSTYEAKNLDESLDETIQNYIGFYNLIEPASSKTDIDICWLPESVCRYQDFLLENASRARHSFGSNFHESFTLRKFLNRSNKKLEFRYRAQFYRYEIRLNYSGSKSGVNSVEPVRRCSNNVRQSRNADENLLQYFEVHCWLLAYLVQRIYEKIPVVSENLKRCACFENLLRSAWTEILRNTFEENQALVGMHENVSSWDMWTYFESLIRKERWKHCLNVINSLPDNLTMNDAEISSLKDKVLGNLVSAHGSEGYQVLIYVRQIKNIHVLAQTVLSNLRRWPVEACQRALMLLINHQEKSKLPTNCQTQIKATLSRITAFHKMLPHFENNPETRLITWYGIASSTNLADPIKIVKSLIDANKFELCLEWLKFHTFSTEMQSLVTKELLIGLLENDKQNFEPATKLLQALPINRSTKLCDEVLDKLESVPAIKFVTSYLLDHCKLSEAVKYHKISIGVEILSRLDCKEISAFIHLLKQPLLMLEQLLMNGKFEILTKILHAVSESLPKAGISLEDVDKIVRYYAGKSLEFRVALQRDGIESRAKDSSSGTEVEKTEFIMPSKVPTKDEWVPDDKCSVCSCCKSVVFSMFNRRHHCRRCGRVVCAVCSQQRMRVNTYTDSVHVRVCDDCKRQTIFRTQQQHGTPSTPSSETFDYWRLTNDEAHNQTVKDEFSFEHAPSISLCLAILNLHSDHKAYASFILDRCDEIKELLQPVASGRVNPEVDHKLLVKMIRSLLVAAKVKCAKLSLNAGLDNCDRMLSHVDLVATLVQSDCPALVPSGKLDHALRRLRDLLTEKEQWILALDVSTKAGLDRQGVWAAWGKSYLKVGCYEQAREKFAHCLDKVATNGFEDWVFLPNYNQADSSPKKNDGHIAREKTRPAKNPPLLTEILQIIESSSFNRQSRRSVPNSKSFTAHDITVTLNNIKAISQGRYQDVETASQNDNAYYHESLHYLVSYGSHSAILEFFIKHDKYDECLLYVVENKVDPDMFFNSVYMPCLKNGCVEKLQQAMRARDPALINWKNYLVFTCHSLETKKLFNTLYQLQIFTKDYVRASMSCIRFYVNGVNSYTDLCNRSKFLQQAQKHLETELQTQNFRPKRRKSTGSQHSGQSSLTLELELSDIDRHINTISRQMEVAKFLRNSEQEGRDATKFLNDLSNMENDSSKAFELPTLFGTQLQKTQLAVLAILCGRDVEEGFGIAFRIIQDYNLRSEKVYSLAGHILASEEKISSVEQLVKCCRSSGAPDTNALSDRVLAHCVKLVLNSQMEPGSSSKEKVDSLIKLITDLDLKISMHIESRQLKAAYLLAVKHSRAQDVRKIFKEADRLEQNAIKTICAKWLKQTQKS